MRLLKVAALRKLRVALSMDSGFERIDLHYVSDAWLEGLPPSLSTCSRLDSERRGGRIRACLLVSAGTSGVLAAVTHDRALRHA